MAKKDLENKVAPEENEEANTNLGEGQAPVPVPKKTETDTVLVEKAVLEQILENQRRLENTIKQQEKDISMLTTVADKGRLAKYEDKNRGTLIRTARVGIWKGDVILGWVMVKDEVGFVHGVLQETQIIKLFLDAGPGNSPKEQEVEYLNFYRNVSRATGDVLKESRGTNGETRLIKLQDGREFELDIRFINL